jgi:hypothetical protein
VKDLAACRTGHRLIYVVVLRNIFGRKALNAIPGFRAAVHEERHVKNTFPLHVTKWIDLDQSPKPLQNSEAANGMERGQNHKKETPTEIGASRYCWQLALNTDPPVTKRV